MNITLFLLILNIVILVFMGLGFLRGLVGLRFTLVRFILFLLALGLTFILMDTVADIIVNAQIISGKTITELFIDIITKSSYISYLYNSSSRIKEVLEQLPGIVFQFLSFMITFIILYIISNIIYTILKIFVLNHITWFDYGRKMEKAKERTKEKQVKQKIKQKKIKEKQKSTKDNNVKNNKTKEERKPKKEKKKIDKVSFRSKIFGGLMGMVFGFVVIFTILLPVSGIAGTVREMFYAGDKVIYASDGSELNENKPISEELFGENYLMIKSYLDAYRYSSVGFITSLGGIDKAFVKTVTTVTVDGKNRDLIDSVENLSVIYEDILYLVNFYMHYTDISSIDNLDLSKVKNIVNYIFENEVFDSLFDEIIICTFDYVRVNVSMPKKISEVTDNVYTEIKSGVSPKDYIKTEVNNVLDVAQNILESKVVSEIKGVMSSEGRVESAKNIAKKLTKENSKGITYIHDILSKLGKSKTLNIIANHAYNAVLEELENIISSNISGMTKSQVNIGRVDTKGTLNFEQIGEIVDNVSKIYSILDTAEISQTNAVYDVVTKTDTQGNHILTEIIGVIEELINNILNLDMLNYEVSEGKTILNNICYYLSQTDKFNVIDFELLTEENALSGEFKIVHNVLDKFYASETYKSVTSEDFEKSKAIELLVKFMNEDYNETSKNSKMITKDLLSTVLFRNIEEKGIKFAFAQVGNIINGLLGTETKFSEVNLTNLYTDEQKEIISDIVQDILDYYVTHINGSENAIHSIIESDYVELGSILDKIRTSEMFADNGTEKGYYTSLILTLQDFDDTYFNFEVAVTETFSWKDTMEQYGSYLNELLNYKIIHEGNEVILFDVITGTTEVDDSEIFIQIGISKLYYFYTNLSDCELVNPLVEIIYKTILDNTVND